MPLYLILLLSLIALSACDTERDATTADDAGASDDRPSGVSNPRQRSTRAPATTEAQGEATTTPGEGGEELHAVAKIEPTEGNDASGTIRLAAGNGTVRVSGTITGLEPGAHGIHVHEFGDCSAPDASSAGDHFDPHGDPHGSPRDPEDAHHVGDLGNVTAREQGEATVDIEDNEMRLGGADSVIGKAIVVHAAQDDFETQPSGDSGAPVACGEIVEAGPEAGAAPAG